MSMFIWRFRSTNDILLTKKVKILLANRLSVLLAERQLSIKQVVEDTGLSRNAVSNIVNKPNANIATETIDILCRYLQVTPNDFFLYWPYATRIKLQGDEIWLGFESASGMRTFAPTIYLMSEKETWGLLSEQTPFDVHAVYVLANEEDEVDSTEQLKKLFASAPIAFQKEIEKKYIGCIQTFLENHKDEVNKIVSSSNESGQQTVSLFMLLPWGSTSKKLNTSNFKII